MDNVKTFAESTDDFVNRIQAAPLPSAIQNFGQSFPSGGACPLDLSLALPWGTVSTDFLCETFDRIKPALSAVFLALWVLIAYRVVAEA